MGPSIQGYRNGFSGNTTLHLHYNPQGRRYRGCRGCLSTPTLKHGGQSGCLDSVDWNDGMERWNGLDWNGGMEWNGTVE